MEKNLKFRSKVFTLVLYPEDETHCQALEKIKQFDHAYILHDRDIENNETGEIKKPHWHVLIRFKNAIYNTSLSEELKIQKNYLQRCRDRKKALLYLVHYYDPDKAQYEVNEVFGPMKDELLQLINTQEKSECDIMKEIYDFIKSEKAISFSRLISWSIENGYYPHVRKSGYLLNKLISETICNRKFEKEVQYEK